MQGEVCTGIYGFKDLRIGVLSNVRNVTVGMLYRTDIPGLCTKFQGGKFYAIRRRLTYIWLMEFLVNSYNDNLEFHVISESSQMS